MYKRQILIDATTGFTEQDSKVAGFAHEQGKACIVAVNKWDAVEKAVSYTHLAEKTSQPFVHFKCHRIDAAERRL